jgi:ankyrin repeat protein
MTNATPTPKKAKSLVFAALLLLASIQAYGAADLFQAVRNNDLPVLRTAVADKANLDARGPRQATLLMHAAAFGNPRSMKILLDAGADPNAKDSFGATALVWAAGDAAKAKLLVERGADVNAQTVQGRTPLIVAAAHDGNARTVRLLLNKGADIHAADAAGDTAMTVAAAAGDLETIKLLLARGAKPDQANKGGFTPLLNASMNGNAAMMRLLIAKGANVNAANVFAGRSKFGEIALKQMTPLMVAAPHGSPEAVRILLESGAAINARDSRGMTPLMFAVASDNQDLDVVEMLIAHDAEINAKSGAGETALDWARKFGDPRVISALEKSGAEAANNTPLYANTPHHINSLNTGQPSEATLSVHEAVERSVRLLQSSGAEFFRQSGCVGCHHQPAVQRAAAAARAAGIAIDETAAAESVQQVVSQWDLYGPSLLERLDGPAAPDIQVAALFGLAAEKHPSGPVTDMLAANIAATQRRDGSWKLEGFSRAPSEESNVARTVMSLRVLQVYGYAGRRTEFATRIGKARRWLENTAPKTTDDYVWRLAGLSWAGSDPGKVVQAAEALRSLQRADGGFAPNEFLESDPYATATALWALRMGGVAVNDEMYQRGVAYLLRTQNQDGSWYVRSRAPKFQPYFESGFPYCDDQWISSSATAWATVALAPAARQTISETRDAPASKQKPGRRGGE